MNVPDVASLSLPFLRSLPSAPAQVAGGQPGIELGGRKPELLPWVLTPGKLCLGRGTHQRRIAKPQQLSGLSPPLHCQLLLPGDVRKEEVVS